MNLFIYGVRFNSYSTNYNTEHKCLTWESRARHSSMMKKQADQKGANGSLERASGYATNTSPGPSMSEQSTC